MDEDKDKDKDKELKEHLSKIRNRIIEDGVENTLEMIKSQNIQGPSFFEVFGKELDLT